MRLQWAATLHQVTQFTCKFGAAALIFPEQLTPELFQGEFLPRALKCPRIDQLPPIYLTELNDLKLYFKKSPACPH